MEVLIPHLHETLPRHDLGQMQGGSGGTGVKQIVGTGHGSMLSYSRAKSFPRVLPWGHGPVVTLSMLILKPGACEQRLLSSSPSLSIWRQKVQKAPVLNPVTVERKRQTPNGQLECKHSMCSGHWALEREHLLSVYPGGACSTVFL